MMDIWEPCSFWDGLVLWLRMDEKSGGTAFDHSAYSNHGTSYGAVPTGLGWRFDGNDYINCGSDDSLNFGDAITVEVWIKVDEDGSFLDIATRNAWNGWMMRRESPNRIMARLEFVDGSTSGEIEGGRVTVADGWSHCAFTYDSVSDDIVRVFVNGQQVKASASMGNKKIKTGGSTRFGKIDIHYFKGLIAEVRIYKRALSSEELRLSYELNKGLFS